MSKRENTYNDKAGIIFLFVLIGTVFLADFFIEMNKTVNFSNYKPIIVYQYFSTDFYNVLSASCQHNNNNSKYIVLESEKKVSNSNHSLELSIIFFLFVSFSSFFRNFNFNPNKLLISFLYFTSFIYKEFSNIALPRPPPKL